MSSSFADIEWSQPILPAMEDPAWSEEVRRHYDGMVPKVHRYVARLPWLRRMILDSGRVSPVAASRRVLGLATLVTSQENACRYCVGTAHAQMRLLGYKQSWLEKVEREASLAGADPAERALLAFCRNLARSNPRPARAESEELAKLGYTTEVVVEVASTVALACFMNRVATFLAVPVEEEFEAMPDQLGVRLLQPLKNWLSRLRSRSAEAPPSLLAVDGPFRALLMLMGQGTAGTVAHAAIEGALGSPILPRRTKAWMFAVVAASLGCELCGSESRKLLLAEGVAPGSIDEALTSLASSSLDPTEALLLPWVRETVRYRTAVMQRKTRELSRKLPSETVLEAIGVAALANAFARLGMLAQ